MDTGATIHIPKVTDNKLAWFPLPIGATYKNVGMNAEVGFSSILDTPPEVLKGELVLQGETIDPLRGNAYILQDAYCSYEFMAVG